MTKTIIKFEICLIDLYLVIARVEEDKIVVTGAIVFLIGVEEGGLIVCQSRLHHQQQHHNRPEIERCCCSMENL